MVPLSSKLLVPEQDRGGVNPEEVTEMDAR
jgi:hypothetical protein